MKRFSALLVCVLLGVLLASTRAWAGPDTRPYHEEVTAFLKKYTAADGAVNYRAVQANPAALRALLSRTATFDAAAAPPAARKAFYLNAYNVLVIGAVVDAYPVASVMKVPGFFDQKTYVVAGERLTLNALETDKLRKPYRDPRIHFALVCGAKGCPPLSPDAYAPATVEDQLARQARRALQDPRFVRPDAPSKKVLLSEIFKWYAADFEASGKALLAYLNQFRGAQPLPLTYAIDYYPYDWALNERR